MQGVYTDHFGFGTSGGNYLRVENWGLPNGTNKYMGEQPIVGQPKSVFSGSETDAKDKFNKAFDAVAHALEQTHDLYSGYNPLFGGTYNSNSVWATALKAMGITNPQIYSGPLKAPGK